VIVWVAFGAGLLIWTVIVRKKVLKNRHNISYPFEDVELRHPVGSIRQAIITGKYGGGVFCNLPDGTVCMCSYSYQYEDSDFRVGGTVILLVLQYVFHHTMHLVKEKKMGRIHLRAGEEGMPPEQVAAALAEMQVRVIATHLSIGKTGEVEAKMDVLFPLDFDAGKLVGLAKDFPEIVTIDT